MNPPENELPADWAELIGYSATLRSRLAEVDPQLSPMTMPRVAASEEQLTEAEQRLGTQLDAQHHALLRHGNGWPLFFTYTDLLSTDELGAGPLWQKAQDLLDLFFAEAPPPADFPTREELLPVAAGEDVTDVFAIWTTGPQKHHGRPILWLAGEEVDRWPNMREWLLSINQYLQNDLTKLAR